MVPLLKNFVPMGWFLMTTVLNTRNAICLLILIAVPDQNYVGLLKNVNLKFLVVLSIMQKNHNHPNTVQGKTVISHTNKKTFATNFIIALMVNST